MTDRELMQQALEALERYGGVDQRACDAEEALRERLAQPEPVQCEPQEAITEDGWCDWVCPKPQGYLMQCCDCELIHEVESRVVKYEPRPSEVFKVVDDPDLQVQWRMKRRDDISPKQPRQWQGLTDEERHSIREWQEIQKELGPVWAPMMLYLYLAIEAKLREKNHG